PAPVTLAVAAMASVFAPVETLPLVKLRTPFGRVTLLPRLTPFGLFTSNVWVGLTVSRPEIVIVCAAGPFSLTLAGEEGLKLRVRPETTLMFPRRLKRP